MQPLAVLMLEAALTGMGKAVCRMMTGVFDDVPDVAPVVAAAAAVAAVGIATPEMTLHLAGSGTTEQQQAEATQSYQLYVEKAVWQNPTRATIREI